MREQQKNTKSASQLKNYKPALDTLEDRSMPGNALLGLTGFSLPFSVAPAQKTLASQLAKASTSLSKTTISTQTSQSQASTSSTAAFFGSAKQSQQFTSPSSSNISIQGTTAATNMSFTSSNDSFEAILNRTAGNAASPVGTASNPTLMGSSPTIAFASATTPGGTGSGTGSGSTSTNQPAYDAATLARLKEYVHQGSLDNRNVPMNLTLSPESLAAADVLKAQMPQLQFREDAETGTVKMAYNLEGTLTGPQTGTASTIAINYLRSIADFLGVDQSDVNTLTVNKSYADTNLTATSAKLSYVYLQQKVAGIPVLGMSTVSVKGNGSVVSVANGMIPNLLNSVNTTTPSVTAKSAVQTIAAHLGLPVTKAIVSVKAESGATRAGSYSDGGFAREAIPTDLTLVPTGNGVRLAWHAIVYLKNDYHFEFYVDAVDGNVLLRNSLTKFDSYRVLPFTAKAPDQGAVTTVTNPADKVASPYGWHDINGKAGADYFITRGNNAFGRTVRDSSLPPGSQGYQVVPSGGSTNTYNYIADFKKDPSTYQAASAVQIFYAANVIHDVTYRHGFNEMAANFQQNNYGRGGVGNDYLIVTAQADADLGATDNAFYSHALEGTSGRVNQFVWDLTGPFRDGTFDNEVVAHEIGHGIQMRAIGGGNVFTYFGIQADATNEGGSDFVSLYFTTNALQATNFDGRTPFLTWALGLPTTGKQPDGTFGGGLRRLPYSANFDINPLTYNDIDPNQIDVTFPVGFPFDASQIPPDESHNAGEIWTNTLWEMMGNLVETNGYSSNLHTGTAGNNIAYQLWVTGLKLTPARPTFLDQRDAIITADLALYGGEHLPEIWAAFAKRGMGQFADDGGTSNTVAVTEDFTIPDGLPDPGNGGGDDTIGGDGSADHLYEPNETSNKAFNLGSVTGESTVDNLMIKQNLPTQAGDRDWFKFTPTTAGVLTLTMTPNTSAGDLDVRLYRSANGSPSALTEIGVTQGTKRVAGAPETITVAVGAGITYYFNTSGFNKALGNYNLTISAPE